jgi:hypothetical protein
MHGVKEDGSRPYWSHFNAVEGDVQVTIPLLQYVTRDGKPSCSLSLISSRPQRTGAITLVITFTRTSNAVQPNVDVHRATSNIIFFLKNITLQELIFFVFPFEHEVKVLHNYYPDA